MSPNPSAARKVGILLLVALAVGMAAIFLVGDRRNLFSRKNDYYIRLDSVSGLQPGSNVQLDGVGVGSIAAIDLSEDVQQNQIGIRVRIEARFAARIREDSMARIRTLGLLGDKYIEISSGSPKFPEVQEGGDIGTAPTTDVDRLRASGEDLVNNVTRITEQLTTILGRMERGEGILGELTKDVEPNRKVTTEFIATLDSIRGMFDDFREGDGPLPRLLNDRTLGDKLEGTVTRLDSLLAKTESGEGALSMLLTDSEQRQRLERSLASIERTTANLESVTNSLQEERALLPKLLGDEAYGEKLTSELAVAGREPQSGRREARPRHGLGGADAQRSSPLSGDEGHRLRHRRVGHPQTVGPQPPEEGRRGAARQAARHAASGTAVEGTVTLPPSAPPAAAIGSQAARMRQHILVTGGAGFIGSHVTRRLLGRGDRVTVLDDFNDFYAPALKRANAAEFAGRDDWRLVEGDIRDAALVDRLFEESRFDAVIHLAARAGVRPSLLEPVLYEEVNCIGTLRLLEAARRHGPANFVFASSSSVYGINEKVPFAEDDAVDRPISPYATTKRAGELLCFNYHHLYGLRTSCLRFFTVYGPAQRPEMAIAKFTDLLARGKTVPLFGTGQTRRDYTFIDDIVDGVLAALDLAPGFEIFNLGGSRTTTLIDLVHGNRRGARRTPPGWKCCRNSRATCRSPSPT